MHTHGSIFCSERNNLKNVWSRKLVLGRWNVWWDVSGTIWYLVKHQRCQIFLKHSVFDLFAFLKATEGMITFVNNLPTHSLSLVGPALLILLLCVYHKSAMDTPSLTTSDIPLCDLQYLSVCRIHCRSRICALMLKCGRSLKNPIKASRWNLTAQRPIMHKAINREGCFWGGRCLSKA